MPCKQHAETHTCASLRGAIQLAALLKRVTDLAQDDARVGRNARHFCCHYIAGVMLER